jgi:hypothetical protein
MTKYSASQIERAAQRSTRKALAIGLVTSSVIIVVSLISVFIRWMILPSFVIGLGAMLALFALQPYYRPLRCPGCMCVWSVTELSGIRVAGDCPRCSVPVLDRAETIYDPNITGQDYVSELAASATSALTLLLQEPERGLDVLNTPNQILVIVWLFRDASCGGYLHSLLRGPHVRLVNMAVSSFKEIGVEEVVPYLRRIGSATMGQHKDLTTPNCDMPSEGPTSSDFETACIELEAALLHLMPLIEARVWAYRPAGGWNAGGQGRSESASVP